MNIFRLLVSSAKVVTFLRFTPFMARSPLAGFGESDAVAAIVLVRQAMLLEVTWHTRDMAPAKGNVKPYRSQHSPGAYLNMTQRWIYFFGNGQADGHGGLKHFIGGKGASLADMTRAGLNVPPGFPISAECCDH
jgi:hypothetical protein